MTTQATSRRWQIVDLAELPAVACPCGEARRAFAERQDFPATIHRTEISATAQRHYHRTLTETYYILDCEPDAAVELDGERVPIVPGMCVLIPPLVRHRAIGRMTILNIVMPKFDPADEWFD